MRTWIGKAENLRDGDVVVGWSRNDAGTPVMEVERVDADTVRLVLGEVRKGLREHGNVDPEDLYQLGKRLGLPDEKVLAEDEDRYFGSDDVRKAEKDGARQVIDYLESAYRTSHVVRPSEMVRGLRRVFLDAP